jgi:hypothetical protein
LFQARLGFFEATESQQRLARKDLRVETEVRAGIESANGLECRERLLDLTARDLEAGPNILLSRAGSRKLGPVGNRNVNERRRAWEIGFREKNIGPTIREMGDRRRMRSAAAQTRIE